MSVECLEVKLGIEPINNKDENVLYPKENMEQKQNYKRQFFIRPDGSIFQKILLNVTDKRLREEIISAHFLKFIAKHIIKNNIGVNIISRDAPWDFRFSLSTGLEFNVEIVSVADSRMQFEILSREERRDSLRYQKRIRLRDLQKTEKIFPSDLLKYEIEGHVKRGVDADDYVDNPDFGGLGIVYLSAVPLRESRLDKLLGLAIDEKEKKPHSGKDSTALIIDDRTSVIYTADFIDAINSISDKITNNKFREIWLYTGYCSDNDGNNECFTLISMKMDVDFWK